jgi:hypothetical protein
MNYREDRSWADQFIADVDAIIRSLVTITVARPKVDREEATDLVILGYGSKALAMRMRRNAYLCRPKYRDQFTIRYHRRSGAKTEFAKIFREGWGDWFFYGFDSGTKPAINPWLMADLEKLRDLIKPDHLDEAVGEGWCGKIEDNKDGTFFLPFNIWKLPAFVFIKLSGHSYVIRDRDGDYLQAIESTGWETVPEHFVWTKDKGEARQFRHQELYGIDGVWIRVIRGHPGSRAVPLLANVR